MNKKTKVVVLYRVLQEWRRPIFERISAKADIDFKLLHGPDFIGSKVVSSKKETKFKKEKLLSLKIRKESKNGLVAMPISIFLFFKLIWESPDIIISEGASNLFNASVGWLYCKIFRKKFIWWSLGKLSGTVHTGFRKKLDNYINYLERSSDAIISYSNLGKAYFSSLNIPAEKIFVAVNVVDTEEKFRLFDELKLKSNKNPNKFNILYVGAMTPQKKLDILLEAFSNIELKRTGCYLTIVGDGSERGRLEALSEKLKLKNIEFTGKVFDGVSKYFIDADIFVLPGLGGLAVSEAMSFGVPVIASVGDGCEKDLIDSGINGIIDESLTSESLEKHLLSLYDAPVQLAQFKKYAKIQIEEKYNIKTYINEVLNAISFVNHD